MIYIYIYIYFIKKCLCINIWVCGQFPQTFICLTFSANPHRYAYSEEVGEESDDEEAHSLTRGKSDGDIGLVEKKVQNGGTTDVYDQEDETEEDKRE